MKKTSTKIAVMHGLAMTTAPAGGGITGVDIFGLFNIFIGLMVVAAIIAFVGGLITWALLLGTVGRQQGIRIMEWGVTILFVLVVLIAIDRYFVTHPTAVTILISAVVVLFIGYIILEIVKGGGAEKEEH